MVFKKMYNWCAATILFSFFLPWVHPFPSVSVPGYKFINYMEGVCEVFADCQNLPFIFYFINLFPLLSIVVLIISIRNKDASLFSLVSGAIFILWFAWYLTRTDIELGVGGYITIIASLGLIISMFIKPTK
tara:strand:- start:142 stop:534 length:393 start_codon:yes stop_codon:yes gene_type:complete